MRAITIMVTKRKEDLFKTVVLICVDKETNTYRSVNFNSRTITKLHYNSPAEIIDSFQKAKDAGKIADFEVVNNEQTT